MPLTEKEIAELILRYIAGGISPEKKQELMVYYASLSTANRLNFEKMIDRRHKYILEDLRNYYEFNKEVDTLAKREFGGLDSDDSKSSEPTAPEDPKEPRGPGKPPPAAN